MEAYQPQKLHGIVLSTMCMHIKKVIPSFKIFMIFMFLVFYCPVSKQMWLPFFQMLMNALVEAITVMLMQPVLTQMGTLPAPAMKGTVVMEASVMVNMNIQYFSLVN